MNINEIMENLRKQRYEEIKRKQTIVLYCVGVLFIITIITLIVMASCGAPTTTTNENPVNTCTTDIDNDYEKIVIYYVVQPGDTWWDLSRQFYGDGSYYEAIAIYNKCSSTDTLYVGDTITIPDKKDEIFISIIEGLKALNSEKVREFNQAMSGQVIQASSNSTEWYYGRFNSPTNVSITVPDCNGSMKNNTNKVDTSEFHLIGQYKITGYTPQCYHCCESTSGVGAAGTQIICGYSVAAPWDLPYGTTLYIEGYGFYVVEDRGNLEENTIDIACPTHDQCYDITKDNVNVYVVGKENNK